VLTENYRLDRKMTLGERVAIFGCAQPDPNVMTELDKAPMDKDCSAVVALLVSKSLVTQERADEILAD
jgi:hypothetical protein